GPNPPAPFQGREGGDGRRTPSPSLDGKAEMDDGRPSLPQKRRGSSGRLRLERTPLSVTEPISGGRRGLVALGATLALAACGGGGAPARAAPPARRAAAAPPRAGRARPPPRRRPPASPGAAAPAASPIQLQPTPALPQELRGSPSPVAQKQWSQAPAMQIDQNKTYVATMNTTDGTLRIELNQKEAPNTVNNFV